MDHHIFLPIGDQLLLPILNKSMEVCHEYLWALEGPTECNEAVGTNTRYLESQPWLVCCCPLLLK